MPRNGRVGHAARSTLADEVAELAREAHALLGLSRAVAELNPADSHALTTCRTAALRYVEELPHGTGFDDALRSLRTTVWAWAPPTLSGSGRQLLDARLPFWVGTVYGLRWRRVPPRA
jgi:hypothetical protein